MKVFNGCCDECFADKHLKDLIRKQGVQGYCDYCKSDRQYCFDPLTLRKLFEPIVGLYVSVEDVLTGEELGEYNDGDMLFELFTHEWQIFSEENKNSQTLLTDIFTNDDRKEPRAPHIFHAYVEPTENFWDEENQYSENFIKTWKKFKKDIQHRNRFTNKLNLEEFFSYNTTVLRVGRHFCRARLNSRNKKFKNSEMGRPPVKKSNSGRCNPSGISYLYLASDAETAAAEIKPYVGEYLTIGKFETKRELKILDMRRPGVDSPFIYGDGLKLALESFRVLRYLSSELSKPITPGKSDLDYLPTQFFCEKVKHQKFDGIYYRSSLASGYNLVLFSPKYVNCFETTLEKIKEIKIKMEGIFEL